MHKIKSADEHIPSSHRTITLSPGKMLRVPRQAKSSNAGNSSDGENIDYNQDSDVKPPHSYAMLIFMAMRHHGSGKVTLAQIYEFILGHFGYYRVADPGWKNSIRHNLTQHKCFLKIARKQGESGKGGFWALDKSYEAMFEGGHIPRVCTLLTPSCNSQLDSTPSRKRLLCDITEKSQDGHVK